MTIEVIQEKKKSTLIVGTALEVGRAYRLVKTISGPIGGVYMRTDMCGSGGKIIVDVANGTTIFGVDTDFYEEVDLIIHVKEKN